MTGLHYRSHVKLIAGPGPISVLLVYNPTAPPVWPPYVRLFFRVNINYDVTRILRLFYVRFIYIHSYDDASLTDSSNI